MEEIDFTPAKRKETEPRASSRKDDCSPLACTKGGPDYLEAYRGFLEELAKICPDACVFKSLPKLDPEETDTAESDGNISKLFVVNALKDKQKLRNRKWTQQQFFFFNQFYFLVKWSV